MRFDDSLKTVLGSEVATGHDAQSAWRQLVDLAGRGRVATDGPVLARLRMLRPAVPVAVRAASARMLAHARPDAALVALFAEDEPAVAAPVLRTAKLDDAEWTALLPRLSPVLRSVLRRRRDLTPETVRALASFGTVDFTLPTPEPAVREPLQLDAAMIAAPDPIARGLPVIAETPARGETEVAPPPAEGYAISDLMARIEAFRRRRDEGPYVSAASTQAIAETPGERFMFETDASGTLIGVEGVARGALVGLSIAHSGVQGVAQVDGIASGGLRRRSRFDDARLQVGGTSSATGCWRLTGIPAFDRDSGRFTGFRGVGRRPRTDESAAPPGRGGTPSPDALRQLVHELRTPTNAIAGFAELIESELLGPVPPADRARATAIRARVGELLAAIEDLDTAARIEVGALELRPGPLLVRPMVERVVADLGALAALRGVRVLIDGDADARVVADDRAAERLLARLFATLIAAGTFGETLRAAVHADPSSVEIAIDRPRSLAGLDEGALLALNAGEHGADRDVDHPLDGTPLLGTGFAIRVARNLAAELGGALEFRPARLTLRLPTSLGRSAEHATTI
ncbi:sensor histidine kinase [uncultured Sphingomonas sp.]|uniref:sensor histidine kinase n=1 Tax=uncultured Sphingomonas sp. TaxID=158754 RepID=UPI0035CAF936